MHGLLHTCKLKCCIHAVDPGNRFHQAFEASDMHMSMHTHCFGWLFGAVRDVRCSSTLPAGEAAVRRASFTCLVASLPRTSALVCSQIHANVQQTGPQQSVYAMGNVMQ